jgi:tryptophan-rich sensory protein
MKSSKIIKLGLSVLLPLGLGAIAGMFTVRAIPGWYASLNKPSFNPPNWIFGPVWTTLYVLMGSSLFLIWKLESSKERDLALFVFLIQLVLNLAWSFVFFYFKMVGFALIEIVVLWITILIMLYLFYKIKPIAAYLNFPYFLWVSFATVLNAGYYFLNRN